MGLVRMALFGALIGFASCQAGLRVERDPEKSARAIGGAVYRSSVACMGGIVVLNLLASILGGTS
jgi:ABC-type transporter Mla maintaining outer membrane lipid asymmetry permease subunit MlaE